jgi:mannose-1-phosphate guanylyltransferase
MKAAVLAGGRGTRLRPLTLTTPKPFIPLANLPLLRHHLESLQRSGASEAAVCHSYEEEWIEEHAGREGEALGDAVPIRMFRETTPLGTAGALAPLREWAGDEPLLAMNGDDLCDANLGALRSFHEEKGARLTLLLVRLKGSAFGHVKLADDGSVGGFLEKPDPTAETGLINAGRYILDPALLDTIPRGRPVSLEREWVPGLIEDGVPVFGLAWEGYFRPLNTPEQLLEIHRDIYERRWRPPWLPALEPGRHLMGADCRVFTGAQLQRNVTLGDGTEVGEGAVLEDVVTFHGVRIGPRAVVRGAVLGRGAEVGEGSVVLECALGDGTVVPPWSALGTLDPGRRGEPA